MRGASGIAACVLAVSCGDDGGGEGPPGDYGVTTNAVVVVNPVINQGSTTNVTVGPTRADIAITATGDASASTDATGLAVVRDLPTGAVTLTLPRGSTTFTVVQEKELYDVVVAHRDDGVEPLFPAVRYPIGANVVEVEPGGDIAAAAQANGTVVLLKPGRYPGGFELRAESVIVFGAWSAAEGPLSTIEGNVTPLGEGIRFRGLRIEGTLITTADDFSAAFCDIDDATITGVGVLLLRNTFVAGQATVPSSDAILVDNQGIP
jgi:hypothetical protein